MKFFTKGKKMTAKEFAAKLMSGGNDSATAGESLAQDAFDSGASIELMIHRHVEAVEGMNPVESVFMECGIPLSPHGEEGNLMLAASSDAFITNNGLKAILPILIDNILRAAINTVPLENVEDLLAQTRNVAGSQLQTDIVYDKNTNDSYGTFRIAEGGRIPVRSLKTSKNAVQFFKHGSGIEISYEFGRRMSPDVLVPYANRIAFERAQSEAQAAVSILVNGTGDNPAAPVDSAQAYDGLATGRLRDRPEAFLKWLIDCAKNGRPVDTVVVNYDTLFELSFMFPVNNGTALAAQGANAIGKQGVGMQVTFAQGLALNITVVLSSVMGENQILGFRKGETLERLIEIGSQIQETERNIRTQMLTYVNSTNSGFNIAYGNSRRILEWTPA